MGFHHKRVGLALSLVLVVTVGSSPWLLRGPDCNSLLVRWNATEGQGDEDATILAANRYIAKLPTIVTSTSPSTSSTPILASRYLGSVVPGASYKLYSRGDSGGFPFMAPLCSRKSSAKDALYFVGSIGHSDRTLRVLSVLGDRIAHSFPDEDATSVILGGDLAYSGFDKTTDWGAFLDVSSHVLGKIPTMVVPGDRDLTPEVSQDYAAFFGADRSAFSLSATIDNASSLGLYGSYTSGPFHVISICSVGGCVERSGSTVVLSAMQSAWLTTELRHRVDRAVTPFLVVVLHAPLYSSSLEYQLDTIETSTGQNLESLLVDAYTDVVLTSHVHSYEVTLPLSHGKVSDCEGIVHVNVGTGGGDLLNDSWISPKPAWSLERKGRQLGFIGLLPINASHFKIERFSMGLRVGQSVNTSAIVISHATHAREPGRSCAPTPGPVYPDGGTSSDVSGNPDPTPPPTPAPPRQETLSATSTTSMTVDITASTVAVSTSTSSAAASSAATFTTTASRPVIDVETATATPAATTVATTSSNFAATATAASTRAATLSAVATSTSTRALSSSTSTVPEATFSSSASSSNSPTEAASMSSSDVADVSTSSSASSSNSPTGAASMSSSDVADVSTSSSASSSNSPTEAASASSSGIAKATLTKTASASIMPTPTRSADPSAPSLPPNDSHPLDLPIALAIGAFIVAGASWAVLTFLRRRREAEEGRLRRAVTDALANRRGAAVTGGSDGGGESAAFNHDAEISDAERGGGGSREERPVSESSAAPVAPLREKKKARAPRATKLSAAAAAAAAGDAVEAAAADEDAGWGVELTAVSKRGQDASGAAVSSNSSSDKQATFDGWDEGWDEPLTGSAASAAHAPAPEAEAPPAPPPKKAMRLGAKRATAVKEAAVASADASAQFRIDVEDDERAGLVAK